MPRAVVQVHVLHAESGLVAFEVYAPAGDMTCWLEHAVDKVGRLNHVDPAAAEQLVRRAYPDITQLQDSDGQLTAVLPGLAAWAEVEASCDKALQRARRSREALTDEREIEVP